MGIEIVVILAVLAIGGTLLGHSDAATRPGWSKEIARTDEYKLGAVFWTALVFLVLLGSCGLLGIVGARP